MFLFILTGVIFFVCLGFILYNKKITRVLFILTAVCGLILFYNIFNAVTAEKSIKLSNETLTQISQIKWKDEENLKNIGFEKHNQEYVFYDVWSIHIDKVDEIPKNVSKYKNFQYNFFETRYGLLDMKRLLEKETPVTRAYFVYVDGLQISLFEHETEGSSFVFEDIINRIYERQLKETHNG